MSDRLLSVPVRTALSVTVAFLLGVSSATRIHAQAAGVLGKWTDPGGSTLQVERCGEMVCARIIGIRKSAPVQVDGRNTDVSLRNRPLCGLQVGTNFRPTDADHATDGTLYDPESGKTYRGSMQRVGDTLALRGYVGLKVFGRTEKWTRAKPDAVVCRR